MTLPVRLADPALVEALAPVRAALLAAARAEAGQVRARAETDATAALAAAEETATRIRAEARAQGLASGSAAAAGERARAHRAARATVQRARRDAYQQLQVSARAQVARLPDQPDYPRLRERLATAAARVLGDGAQVHEADGGGVVGTAPGRRRDWSLARFADLAVQAVAGRQSDRPGS